MGALESFIHPLLANSYINAVIILLVCIIIAKLTIVFFKRVVEKFIERSNSQVNGKIIHKLESPIIIIILLAGLLLAAREATNSLFFFENLIHSIIIFIILYMVIGVSNILVDYWLKIKHQQSQQESFHAEIVPLIKSLAKILFFFIAIALVLQLWGVQVGGIVASFGVIGVILGFAFQDSMKNIFGGIALTSDNSFEKHQVIRLDSGEIGEVVEINLRSTKIKTFDNDYLIVPNGMLANSKIANLAQPTATIRVLVPVSVAYGSDVEHVKKTLLNTLKGEKSVLKFPKRTVRFMKMADYSLDFDFLFYISDYRERYFMIDRITTKVYDALNTEGIEIPFPTRSIYNRQVQKPKKVSKKK